MIEYWLAAHLGRTWLRIHPGLQSRLGHLPQRCAAVARGEQIPAAELWQVQDFAVRVWWRLAMALIVVCILVVGMAAALGPGPAGRDSAAALIAAIGGFGIAALPQAGMIRYRSDRTRLYMRRHGTQSEILPPPSDNAGTPRRADFWIVLTITLVIYAVLLAAGLPSGH